METDSPKRFDRILAILIQLQSKKVVKAHELAERFQVSLRTIYRDIRSLEISGVPVYGEAGTGYSLVDGYRLPPVQFTREEAGSFVAAEKLMQQFADQNLRDYFVSAMLKVRSVLRNSEKDWVTDLSPLISVNSHQRAFNEDIPNTLEVLFESLTQKKQALLHYQKPQETLPQERWVEPVGLFYENHYWYFVGFCHLRRDYRQFRLDRIKGITPSKRAFTRTHVKVEELLEKGPSPSRTTVRLLVDKEVSMYLKYDRHYYGFVSEKEVSSDQVEMLFETVDTQEGFPRWFLMFGDCAEIVEPASLRVRVREILEETRQRLQH